MNNVLDAFSLYKRQFGKIMAVSLLLIFPMEMIYLFLSNYIAKLYGFLNLDLFYVWFVGFFNLIFLTLFQIPFIYLAYKDGIGEEYTIGEIMAFTLENALPIYAIGIIYAILVSLGLAVFIIPGILILIYLFPFPYVAVIEKEFWWAGLKSAIRFAQKNFFGLLGIVLTLQLIEWLVGFGLAFISNFYIHHFGFAALSQIVLNMLFVPFFTFVVTRYYMEKADVLADYDVY